ncbi:MAG: hypothetical protein Kow00121_00390 [Elainellaceae cyanobacterium]
MKAKWETYKELELIPDAMWEQVSNSKSKKVSVMLSIRALLSNLWGFAANILIESDEPQIWKKYDSKGYPFWSVYDPDTKQSYLFSSEADVLTWIEERYYRSRSIALPHQTTRWF